jgi:hypothetical protein
MPAHVVPNELSLFPGVAIDPPLAGSTTPLCNMKQITVAPGKNAATDFFFFTEVPKAARGVGLINNDIGIVPFDPNNPWFGEKAGASWIPISLQDHKGNEFSRAYTDQWGVYNFLVPSSHTINVPNPTGVSPRMVRFCLNHPGPYPDPANPGQMIMDPNFNPRYAMTCYTFDFWPGKTTYLDTPVIAVSAFAELGSATLDCELPDGTPVASDVTGPGAIGPYVSATGETVVIASPGTVQVQNPDCAPFDPACSATIARDFGFGTTTGTVTVGGVALTNVTWSNTSISGTVPAGAATGQLVVTRGDNNKSTVEGVTLTVGGPAPTVVSSGGSIQAAVDAAAAGDLIIVRPGSYNENVIVWKNVRLQGSGAFTTIIQAAAVTPEKMQLWRSKMDSLLGLGSVSLVPGEDPATHLEEAAGITVVAKNDGSFSTAGRARIDGFAIASATGGGGITVNGYASDLDISNNRIVNNAGWYGGGIRIGSPSLLDPACTGYCSSENSNIRIHHNHIAQNGAVGGVNGGGGIGLFNGANAYEVTNNYVCGNLTANKGGGIAHFGFSPGGVIANNSILFNESSFNPFTGGHGGGILIQGEAEPLGGGLTAGTGPVAVIGNLIQGNLAGSGSGGGILASFVNGQDVAAAPGNPLSWYSLEVGNNMIVNNAAAYAGGGILLEDTVNARIVNNTVANNDSTATGALAFEAGVTAPSTPQPAGIVARAHSGGLATVIGAGFSNPLLENNIIFSNRSFYFDPALNGGMGGLAPNGAMPIWDLQVVGTAAPQALNPQYCLLTSAAGYSGTNFAGNPLFVNGYLNALQAAVAPQEGGNWISVTYLPAKPWGDYHVREISPAVDHANAATAPSTDYDGEARPNGAADDIGADEFYTGYAPVMLLADKAAIFRGAGKWYLDANGNGVYDQIADFLYKFGMTGDIPVSGDWDGDGIGNIGVYRAGYWYRDTNANGVWNAGVDASSKFGTATDKPVTGDWNGDGTTEIGVYRNGTWLMDLNGNGVWNGSAVDRQRTFGTAADTPVTGDWNGDGVTDIGTFNAGTWQLDLNGNGIFDGCGADLCVTFGQAGDVPVAGDWNADGVSQTGVFRGNGMWHLDLNGDGVQNDAAFKFGITGDKPVAGKW